ncbi:MAG TPA: O-antigen ligase family protein [Gaiellaceae bacterium]
MSTTSARGELGYPESQGAGYALASRAFDAVPFVLAAAIVGAVAAAGGGYFPDVRAWTALAALWFVLLAFVFRTEVTVAVPGLLLAGGLALFTGWSALSLLWTRSATLTVLDVEKLLVYLGVVVAALLVVRRRTAPQLLAGVLVGITLVSAYALATRVFPERLGDFDPLAGYRLTTPVGYWNALGIFSGIGVLLAFGLAARAERPWRRALAAAALPLLMATFFFTFSRGAWVALVVGLVASVALDPRRLQLLASLVVVGLWPALAVLLADRSDALTTTNSAIADASHEGHRLVVWIVVLSVAAAAAAFALGLVEQRVQVPPVARLAFAVVLALAVVACVGVVWAQWGSPPSLARKAYDSFIAPRKATGPRLSDRLLDLSANGRIELWRVSWHDATNHPLAGTGAGTYEQSWAAQRRVVRQALDTHSLYLQTLGELGVIGLALLLVALVPPLVAGVRARRSPLVPIAFGAYVAFLVHGGVDWDWQLTGVGAAGLLCAVALVASEPAGRREVRLAMPGRIAAATVALALAAFAFTAVMANVPVDSAQSAAVQGNWSASAADASKAKRWEPWSSDPWRLLGEAQLAQAQIAAARRSFRTAVAKDPHDWELWVDLGIASTGAERREALATAVRLNPRDPTVRDLARRQLIHRPR